MYTFKFNLGLFTCIYMYSTIPYKDVTTVNNECPKTHRLIRINKFT